MTEIMIFIHYRLSNRSLTTVIYVNNLCSWVGELGTWGLGELGTWGTGDLGTWGLGDWETNLHCVSLSPFP